MTRYRIGSTSRRQRRFALLAFGLVGSLVLGACGGNRVGADSAPRGYAAPLIPATSGHLLRPLWQRALGYGLVIDDGLVLSLSAGARTTAVSAASALTGSPVWTAKPPDRLNDYGLVPGAGIVVVEVGRLFGHAPALVAFGITEYLALDLRTGRRLWTADVPGHLQNPPIVISSGLVVTASLSGAITARQATTGRVLWRRQPPSGCWRRGPGPLGTASALAADETQVAASFSCDGYRVLVQMLDPSTGGMSWQWEPPQSVGAQTDLSATGVASHGNVVLMTGQVAPPAGPYPFARTIPRSFSWPTSLGPSDDIQAVLALDARTGQPRWIELGGQEVSFTLTDGAVCETVSTGLECRDDVTGAPTGPVLATGQTDVPSFAGDGSAGISGSIAAVTVAPFGIGRVGVELVPVRGDRPLGQAEVGTGTSPATASHATEQAFVVAAGTLPGGRTLLLLRRVDLPTYPLIALEVTG